MVCWGINSAESIERRYLVKSPDELYSPAVLSLVVSNGENSSKDYTYGASAPRSFGKSFGMSGMTARCDCGRRVDVLPSCRGSKILASRFSRYVIPVTLSKIAPRIEKPIFE